LEKEKMLVAKAKITQTTPKKTDNFSFLLESKDWTTAATISCFRHEPNSIADFFHNFLLTVERFCSLDIFGM
jgi:hypothetical protein